MLTTHHSILKKLLQDHKPDSVSSSKAYRMTDCSAITKLFQMLTFIYLVPASLPESGGLPTSGTSFRKNKTSRFTNSLAGYSPEYI